MYHGFYREPPRYENCCRAAHELKQCFPSVKIFSIGKSVLGRTIYAYGIGDLQQATLFVGGVHGMEWITTLLLYRLLEDILRAVTTGAPLADMDITHALENRSLVVIPCLNPDGVEIQIDGSGTAKHLAAFVERVSGGNTCRWQANAHGIDLNHNFDAGFSLLQKMEQAAGIITPAPTRYGGTMAHSEPETRALVSFCRAVSVRQAYAYHAQGEEIYYQYGGKTPARAQLMARVLATTSGYRLASPEGLASHGGFKDWFIEQFCRPGFTIEVGRGENPLPVEELEPIYARLLEMMLISILL